MNNYIITGAPGVGKTSVLKELAKQGYSISEEAATKLIEQEQKSGIKEPWMEVGFIDRIILLQRQIQLDSLSSRSQIQFFDRSPLDTLALSIYLGKDPSDLLIEELDRIKKYNIYQKKVFFLDNLGFIKNTDVRQISFQESLKFEKIHENIFNQYGYECVKIIKAPVEDRAKIILKFIS